MQTRRSYPSINDGGKKITRRPPLYRSDQPRFTISIGRILDWIIWSSLNEEKEIAEEKMTLKLDDPRLIQERERFEKAMKKMEDEENERKNKTDKRNRTNERTTKSHDAK
jgi:hypothetical protein